jgi:hypothetical protein
MVFDLNDRPPVQNERIDALVACGDRLFRARRISAAAECYERATRVGGDVELRAGERWVCSMLQGDFFGAWRESDRVLQARRRAGKPDRTQPLPLQWSWDGEPVAGRRVLLRCDHSLGDTLQFLRYVPQLRQLAGRLVARAPGALLPLLRTMPEFDGFLSAAEPLTDAREAGFDCEIEAMELPHYFRAGEAPIPSAPYLNVMPAPRPVGGPLRVGLIWNAGGWDTTKSVPLQMLQTLTSLSGVRFLSLQRGPALAELQPNSAIWPASVREGTDGEDMLRLGSRIASLDLLITVDTTAAHLAGAIGAPVWTLLGHQSDWRWMLERGDSPWYPSMKLFRQPVAGAWGPTIHAVRQNLQTLVAARRETDAPSSLAPCRVSIGPSN